MPRVEAAYSRAAAAHERAAATHERVLAFKNAGDCASHGAQGNDTNGLVISMSMSPSDSYPCAFGPTRDGTVTGSGLLPGSTVKLFFTFDQPGPPMKSDVTADSSGKVGFPSWATPVHRRGSAGQRSSVRDDGPETRPSRPPW